MAEEALHFIHENKERPFFLKNDISEQHNVASEYPEIVKKLTNIMKTTRTKSKYLSFPEIYELEM